MILKIDASALRSSGGCQQALWNITTGLTSRHSRSVSASIAFGNAVHKFAEHMIVSKDSTQALRLACKYYSEVEYTTDSKTKHLNGEFLIQACEAVESFLSNERFSILEVADDSGVPDPLCELKVTIPWTQTEHHAILICGTIDMIGKYDNGPYFIADWKTTNSWDVNKYLGTYRLSTQMLMYRWMIRKLSEIHGPDSIYAKVQSGIRNQIFAVTTAASKIPSVIKSDLFEYNDGLLDSFEQGIRSIIGETILNRYDLSQENLEEQFAPRRNGLVTNACGSYTGSCPYSSLCHALSPEVEDSVRQQHFILNPYDPLSFR